MEKIFIVVPNWNGADLIASCLDSLMAQTRKAEIVVVDNGSTDESVAIVASRYPAIHLTTLPYNTGFAGGVNAGIRYALEQGAEAVALFNNDAQASPDWLKHLAHALEARPSYGITTGKLLSADKKSIDSTGDFYTSWGLPYPRGRGELATNRYDDDTDVFGASGGASLYRAKMLSEIGLFDEDFFAYYEDVDLSFRAQLAGWKVLYVPAAEAYHLQGATSSGVKGFTTYQTFKNFPLLFWKNVPLRLLPGILVRFKIAYFAIFFSSIRKRRAWPAIKGFLRMLTLFPKKLGQRWHIQKSRKVSVDYINSIIVHDLPPNAHRLRKLRSFFIRHD
ncbi:MAG TPA: glycosyltransferase family 2 protein [Candidatus Saccharimonadales bacterium]|nr:glycosyltransferase family 2 protein [Candidatus Saccharimonadales bacterium]